MSISIKYRGIDLSFDHVPTTLEIQAAYDRLQKRHLKKVSRNKDDFPLSTTQQQIWFQEQSHPGTATFNVPMGFHIEGPLDVKIFIEAVEKIVTRHDILRSKIIMLDKTPRMTLSGNLSFSCPIVDLTHLNDDSCEDQLEILKEKIFNAPFDLYEGPLFRCELVKKSEQNFLFLAAFHHLVIDQRSLEIFVKELFSFYKTPGQPLENLELSFRDFAAWEKDQIDNDFWSEKRAALVENFSGDLPNLALFPDYTRGDQIQFKGAFSCLSLDEKLVSSMRHSATRHSCTPYVLALTALAVLFYRYTGQRDLVIGTPFAGRTDPRLAKLMGLFVNLQPIRLEFASEVTFEDLIPLVRDSVLFAEANQNYPLLSLLSDLPNLEREPGRPPLFQTIFTYEANNLVPDDVGDLKVSPLVLLPTSAKFDISFTYREAQNGSLLAADFRTDLFETATIDGLLKHWMHILEVLCDCPSTNFSTVSLLSSAEVHTLTRELNPKHPKPTATTIHCLVAEAAKKQPDAIAIVHGQSTLTYKELNRRANQIAHRLIDRDVKKGSFVVLFFDRGIDAIVAMLAVLKTGAAYIPLDPAEPDQRLKTIVTDAKAELALCEQRYEKRATDCDLVAISVDQSSFFKQPIPDHDPEIFVEPDDLMNVLYTSGSTGAPKGVALPHRGITRLVEQPNFINLQSHDVIAHLCPLNFDGATFEIWGALANGAQIAVIEKNVVLSPRDLGESLFSHKVTTLIITTPLLNRLIEDFPEALRPLRYIVFGGEIISKQHMKKALEYCARGVLIHTYGPTENSFTSCHYPIHHIDFQRWTIPIGKPVPHTEIYILDESFAPVPFGVVGEIYLSGQGLARGYLNDPEKTAQSFIKNPFVNDDATKRMYRTGDRGRRLHCGLIEFVGRNDNQIKIRSQRVELGEVEQALRKNPIVAECFVTTIPDSFGHKQLIAYFVPHGHDAVESQIISLPPNVVDDVRTSMRQLLPDYMMPAHFIAMSALPLNQNGKVKRSALPRPHDDARVRVEPASEISTLEIAIKEIWKNILSLNDINVTDNFFEIGGHSLALVKVQNGIEEKTGIRLPIAEFFRHTTIRALASAVEDITKNKSTPKIQKPIISVKCSDDTIAIIGMAIRAPMANDVDEFWQNLKQGRDCISTFSADEVDPHTRKSFEQHNNMWIRAGGLLNDVYGFDPGFFSISEYEARMMDPQQRILLECVADAIDNAALDLKSRKSAISVYVGATPNTYGKFNSEQVSGSEALAAQASSHSVFMATKISHILDLRGESIMVDTLCSTSLVAVHMACTSLLTRSSDYAIAGGVTIQTPQKVGYLYEPNFIMSNNGQCRAFDKDASGTVPGNGAGVVLLRRLSDALRDGDPIHALILGSAVNNDGRDKGGYYSPSVKGQAEVIGRAQQIAKVGAESISYIEAHGTATKLGDPIEISALSDVFKAATTKRDYCAIGSVKTNIGHLGNAAGVAGLIKAALALKHRYIPASLHYQAPNPHIDFKNSPFFVAKDGHAWHAEAMSPRRAGVSSYGIGGTNAHVILEDAS